MRSGGWDIEERTIAVGRFASMTIILGGRSISSARPQRFRQIVRRRRAPDLDVDDPLVAGELEHPRHRGAGHAEPLRDLLLRELIAE